MIIEEYDPSSEEPREISPRDKFINWLIFILVVVALGLLAYASRQGKEAPEEFDCYHDPINEEQLIGKSISLKYDISVSVDENIYQQGDLIELHVLNMGETAVWFPKGFNLSIFEWTSETNAVGRINLAEDKNNFEIVLSPITIDQDGIVLFAKPKLLENYEPKYLMISIWGYRYENDMYCIERHEGGTQITIFPAKYPQEIASQ